MTPFSIQPAIAFEPNMRGAWQGVPMEVYQASPGESNSMLALVEESPAKYQMAREGKYSRPMTHDLEMGTLIHSVVNEGLSPRYHVRPDVYGPEAKKWTMNANECKAWVAARNDKPILTEDEVKMLGKMADLVKRDPKAMRLLSGAHTEISACAYNDNLDYPYLLRVRFDIIGRDQRGWYFADTKSTRNASTEWFSREINKRNYHAQLALYRRVLRRLTGEEVRCYLIAIEKSFILPRINVRQLSEQALVEGDKVIDSRLALLKRCKMSNRWPALPDDEGHEEIQFIDLPDYCYDDAEDEISVSATT